MLREGWVTLWACAVVASIPVKGANANPASSSEAIALPVIGRFSGRFMALPFWVRPALFDAANEGADWVQEISMLLGHFDFGGGLATGNPDNGALWRGGSRSSRVTG